MNIIGIENEEAVTVGGLFRGSVRLMKGDGQSHVSGQLVATAFLVQGFPRFEGALQIKECT